MLPGTRKMTVSSLIFLFTLLAAFLRELLTRKALFFLSFVCFVKYYFELSLVQAIVIFAAIMVFLILVTSY